MQVSAFEYLEIVYLHKPDQILLGKRSIAGLQIHVSEGTIDTVWEAKEQKKVLYLFVLTPFQMQTHLSKLHRLYDKGQKIFHMGFCLIENPRSPTTIKLRKKLFSDGFPDWCLGDLKLPYSLNELMQHVFRCAQNLILHANQNLLQSVVSIREVESKAINDVGQAMTSHATIDELTRLILEKAVELSTADAGFMLLKENILNEFPSEISNNVKLLRNTSNKFIQKTKVCKSQNLRIRTELFDPQRSPFTSFIVNRACGVAWNKDGGQVIKQRGFSISEFSQIPFPEIGFDSRTYGIQSFCAFPLRTPSEEVVGYLLLLNRRTSPSAFLDTLEDIENNVTSFSQNDLNLLEALANQAGVSIDHTRLIKDLKKVFESFVQASVVAIESRDPSTKGHSERVGILTVGLAEAVNRTDIGPYGNITFTPAQLYELKYASLLHDFGKIGVREDVLRKERKLFPQELTLIRERFLAVEKQLHLKCLESYLEGLMKKGLPPTIEDIDKIHVEVRRVSEGLSSFWQAIVEANEPHVVNQENFQKIIDIAAVKIAVGADQMELLESHEVAKLSIRRGSLSPEERMEIESHVTHSYRFLIQIPWTQDLANIPDIVHAHHERLDGSGYPNRAREAEIPIQARIMAITDIYDALVAMDRPYKKAIPAERALSILESEVKEGKLDKYLFKIFVEARIGDLITHINKDRVA